jgi:hypothetical protein
VTATINVPLIPPSSAKSSSIDNSSDRLSSKKTDQSGPPIPQPRSLFDIDNATSAKLADKLQQEAKKCDLNSMGEDSTAESSPSGSEPLGQFTDALPPSPIHHHTIFGERRPSWRMRTDFNNKVIYMELYVVLLPLSMCTLAPSVSWENLLFFLTPDSSNTYFLLKIKINKTYYLNF